jgi:protein ImuA
MYSTQRLENGAHSHLAQVWRADRLDAKVGSAGHATGFDALDAELPDRGWPRAGLIEILGPCVTGGEWSLLAPWLRRHAAAAAGPILCLNPPYEPYAPGLHQLGFPLERMLLVRAATAADAAWAGEQALQVMPCTTILWWVSANISDVTPAMLRRLHLASIVHPTPVFVFGKARSSQHSSPAPLRLLLEQAQAKLALTVIKRRGPPMTHPIELERPILDMASVKRWQTLTSRSLQKRSMTRGVSPPTAAVDHVLARPAPAGFAA